MLTYVLSTLTHMINFSSSTAQGPQFWKQAQVITLTRKKIHCSSVFIILAHVFYGIVLWDSKPWMIKKSFWKLLKCGCREECTITDKVSKGKWLEEDRSEEESHENHSKKEETLNWHHSKYFHQRRIMDDKTEWKKKVWNGSRDRNELITSIW